MNRMKEPEKIYHSMEEFEKKYFPEVLKQKRSAIGYKNKSTVLTAEKILSKIRNK